MELGLAGKVALQLDGGGGLGRGIATALAREGAHVELCDLNQAALDEAVAAVKASGRPALGMRVDLADQAALDDLVARTAQELGEIDILVNISGGPPPGPIAGIDRGAWSKHFASMVLPFFQLTDRVLPAMRRRGWGRIITSTSSGIIAPIPDLGISNTLRSALLGWSKTLAREVAVDGVTVNLVVPGRIGTARIRQLDEARAGREGRPVDEIIDASTSSIPVGRYGKVEEYADVVAFLASARASYVTGSVIRVDGGLLPNV
jgi:3-oxoacyl-[acyl-carrier protein] reductase